MRVELFSYKVLTRLLYNLRSNSVVEAGEISEIPGAFEDAVRRAAYVQTLRLYIIIWLELESPWWNSATKEASKFVWIINCPLCYSVNYDWFLLIKLKEISLITIFHCYIFTWDWCKEWCVLNSFWLCWIPPKSK